jgi:uncharacterized protein
VRATTRADATPTAAASKPPAGADPQAIRGAVARHVFGADATPTRVQLVETHISWLFLAGGQAFKLKKPVRLPFVDYRTAQRRRRMCHEEVRLNARLAPSIYRGVVAVDTDTEGLRLGPDTAGALDYMVAMRRYEEQQSLAWVLARGTLDETVLERMAARLAAFHHDAPRYHGHRDPRIRVERAITSNIEELLELVTDEGTAARVRALRRFMEEFLAAHAAIFAARADAGLVREVHGDLRAEHVILGPDVEVVDCVEFDAELRRIDVIDDLAFLVMDLRARGAESVAERLLGCYKRAGGDCGDPRLMWFYAAHRALVRAKVALLDGDVAGGRGDTITDAKRLLTVAEQCAWRARGRLILAICGPPASGKSRLADELAARTGARVLRSDELRKQLTGLAATERGPAALYQPAISQWTYTELASQAASLSAEPGPVIVDATFRRRDDRAAFVAGLPADSRICFVQCVCPVSVLLARARARERDPNRISDADAGIVASLSGTFSPLDEIAGEMHLLLRTDRDEHAAVDDLLARLDQRIAGERASACPRRS